MHDWLESNLLRNGEAPYQNSVGLAKGSIDLLAQGFVPLEKKSPGIVGCILRYLLDGEGEDECLAALRAISDAGSLIGLVCCDLSITGGRGTRSDSRLAFYQAVKVDPAPSEFWYRLGRVFDAASSEGRRLLMEEILGEARWLEILLADTVPEGLNHSLNAADLENALKMGGHSPDLVWKTALHCATATDYPMRGMTDLFNWLPGLGRCLENNGKEISASVREMGSAAYTDFLSLIKYHCSCFDTFAVILSELAVVNARMVRASAVHLLIQVGAKALHCLKEFSEEGNASVRAHAVSALGALGQFQEPLRTTVKEHLEARRETEKVISVMTAIEEALVAVTVPPSFSVADYGLEEVPDPDLHAPLPASAVPLLEQLFNDLEKASADWLERWKIDNREGERVALTISAELRATILEDLCKRVINDPPYFEIHHRTTLYDWRPLMTWLRNLPQEHPFSLIHLLRLLMGFQQLRESYYNHPRLGGSSLIALLPQLRRSGPDDLRTLSVHLEALGFSADALGWSLLSWEGKKVRQSAIRWPYFAAHIEIMEQVLGARVSNYDLQDYELSSFRKMVLKDLLAFPVLPPSLVDSLWKIALGNGKTERPMARDILKRLSDDQEMRLLEALQSKLQQQRALAAEWLGELQNETSLDAIIAAARKEKSDVALSAMMGAIEALGGSVAEFLDRERLQDSAVKDLKKGLPKSLNPYRMLACDLVWDDGSKVDPIVGQWFLLKASKFKSPEPSPLLKRHCDSLDKDSRAQFAESILEKWLQRGGEVKEKGLLGLVAVCGDKRVALPAHGYIKKFYGTAASQSKALVRMLAWIDAPEATQILLNLGKRFRTRSIQEEANAAILELAERKGWSVEDLADRTIPDAGLDQNGTLRFSYDERQFTASFSDALDIKLSDEYGQILKAMPGARKDEDAERVKSEKKRFSILKKEVKATVRLQIERLYEAMCTQRTWIFSEWKRFVASHPIAGRMCQQLLWLSEEGQCFRLMNDGSLTDANHGEIQLSSRNRIRVAHRYNMRDEDIAEWQEHYDDYELSPLFDQWNKSIDRLSESDRESTEINDFRGHCLLYRRLDSKAKAAGFLRSPTEGGGRYYSYRKFFSGLRIEAVLEFSGMTAGSGDGDDVAIHRLYFVNKGNEGNEQVCLDSEYEFEEELLMMSEVPPVLLSECYHDVKTIVRLGEGFRDDWELLAH